MRYSKYKNVRTNGSDSKKEAKRKQELQMMEHAGKIQDLQYQVEFELIPTQREPDTVGPKGGIKRGKCIEHACKYVADFVYTQNGEKVVEDVKGYRDGSAYAIFTIKRKLMLWRYGIRIKET